MLESFINAPPRFQSTVDNAFLNKCASEIRKTLQQKSNILVINLCWWHAELAEIKDDVKKADVYFAPQKGLLSARMDTVFKKLQKRFELVCQIDFGYIDGQTECFISKKRE